jgi:NAD(P)H-dependent flavin oxidoreductase YrpB (nitropropane dioxygenase family)
MPSGQVAGLIEDLPSCAELIGHIMADAIECLGRLDRLTGWRRSGQSE